MSAMLVRYPRQKLGGLRVTIVLQLLQRYRLRKSLLESTCPWPQRVPEHFGQHDGFVQMKERPCLDKSAIETCTVISMGKAVPFKCQCWQVLALLQTSNTQFILRIFVDTQFISRKTARSYPRESDESHSMSCIAQLRITLNRR